VGALVLLVAVGAAFIIVDRAMLLAQLDSRLDSEMAHQVDEFRRLADGHDPETGKPFVDDLRRPFDVFFEQHVARDDEVIVGLVGGRVYAHSTPAAYPMDQLYGFVKGWSGVTKPKYGSATTPNGMIRWLAVPVTARDGSIAGTLVFGRLSQAERDAANQAVGVAIAAGFFVFLAAALSAWLVTGKVLQPLKRIADAAASVREGDLAVRIPVTGHDELADLSLTFNDMLERVEETFATQRKFLDDASHELRTPLTVIRGHLELSPPDEPLSTSTRYVVFDEIDRMGRIVEDLLVLAKTEGVEFMVPSPTDVADLTVEIVDKARTLGERQWVAQPAAVIVVDLDRQRITQAWMNLVRNAVQHTCDGDRITVFAKEADGWVELGVADTGDGVDPSDRESIFSRFGRGQSARRSDTDGAGLGLAIAAAIARAHGGAISLYETPGGGATFVMRIPLDVQPPLDDTQESPWPAS
jgi:signal transduction histidine kinase